jgi:hypothetical protein
VSAQVLLGRINVTRATRPLSVSMKVLRIIGHARFFTW